MNSEKPPYRVPSMAEIAAVPWNGFTAISTFSGCGGSCLGYRMAGFRVAWANEFVPIAQESYKANADPRSILDGRDIRMVKAEQILEAIGLKSGEIDVLDGSPPCQAFSTAGKRERGWGKAKEYEHGAKQCNETLFDEYIRLVDGLRPKVFIAENVSGLVKGTAKGYFLEILAKLKECGYKVQCRVVDAQWLGVPQARQRTIFIGVREDLDRDPAFPKPLPYRYGLREAIPWIVSSGGISTTGFGAGKFRSSDLPCQTIMAGGGGGMSKEQFGVKALIKGGTGAAFDQKRQTFDTDKPCPTVLTKDNQIVVEELDISRFSIGKEWDRLRPGEWSDRYQNLVSPHPDAPRPTICASHGHPGIASVTHPVVKRKLTIAELKRICAFPDDFVLKGSYSQQWERLGNSVPPVMMYHIARTVQTEVLER